MRRLVLIGSTIALAYVASALVLGCGGGSKGASANAQASPSTTTWVQVVSVAGRLSGRNSGGGGLEVDVKGGGVRFLVTVGAAPGWGAKVAAFHYELYPAGGFKETPPAVPLSAAVTSGRDSTRYDLRSTAPLTPGRYQLLYYGAGWYNMVVYVSGNE